MLNLKTHISRYLAEESGATAIEYGLLAALVGIAIIGGSKAVSGSINDLFADTDGEVQKTLK